MRHAVLKGKYLMRCYPCYLVTIFAFSGINFTIVTIVTKESKIKNFYPEQRRRTPDQKS